MARAEAASASAHSDSIKGLAQSIARPAYRRLSPPSLPAPRRSGAHHRVSRHARRSAPSSICSTAPRRPSPKPPTTRNRRRRAGRAAGPPRRTKPADADPAARSGRCSSARCLAARDRRMGRRIADRNADGMVIASQRRDNGLVGRKLDDIARRRRAAGDIRRRRGRHGSSRSPTDQPCWRPCATSSAARPACGHADARATRWRTGAADTTLTVTLLGHHRLRGADPRLRLPLAGDARARGRPDLRHGAQPHRHRAQPRPLRPVGLGPRARPHVLVAIDVRYPRAASRRTSSSSFGEISGLVHPGRHPALRAGAQLADARTILDRSRLPHAPRARQLGLAAGALRAGAAAGRSRRRI